ncbi:MAG: hypothetical protein F4151_17450, partial [Gammaproteobacteria bacterium]|nr:hypothetical protein [Gammaproteobacteria bacterium]
MARGASGSANSEVGTGRCDALLIGMAGGRTTAELPDGEDSRQANDGEVERRRWANDNPWGYARDLNEMLRYDLFYLMAALLASPVVAARLLATGKRRTDWRGRFGHVGVLDVPSSPTDGAPPGPADSVDRSAGHAAGEVSGAPARRRPTVLVHGVSVGEVAAIRQLVGLLAARTRVVVSSTTDTGVARARVLYSSRHAVVRYPLDLSWMVRRFLDAVRPDVVALAELEVWPNFVTECTRRGIPVCVVNGRLSPSSYRGYRRARAWLRPVFRQLAAVAAQNEGYADRFIDVGVPRD